MGSVLPAHAIVVNKAGVGFMHQRGGLQAVSGTLLVQVAAREPPEFVVDDGCKPVERALISPLQA